MKYNIFDTDRSLFADDIIIEASSMSDAVAKYLGDKLKPTECVRQYSKGRFVVRKHPNGRRYVFGVFKK